MRSDVYHGPLCTAQRLRAVAAAVAVLVLAVVPSVAAVPREAVEHGRLRRRTTCRQLRLRRHWSVCDDTETRCLIST